MFCCVALNLTYALCFLSPRFNLGQPRLVLVYGVNGKKMAKFYLLGAVLVCAACTIPMWVAGEFG
jgi:hypothetical protein